MHSRNDISGREGDNQADNSCNNSKNYRTEEHRHIARHFKKVFKCKVSVAVSQRKKYNKCQGYNCKNHPPAAAPEYTTYIVQRGDSLSKISKKFNIRIDAIRKANPSIKKDVILIGMKLKLPGKVDVGVQTKPVEKPIPAAKTYKGATKEYVVKSGDTLGAIAYGNGINIRQLKALNNLSSDNLRVGMKLKVPAVPVKTVKKDQPAKKPVEKTADAKVAPAPAPAAEASKADEAKAEAKSAPEVPAEPAAEASPAAEAPAAEAPKADEAKSAAPAAAKASDKHETYVVQEGDDMTGVSIRWGVSAAAIRELNNLGEKDQLTPGQIIKLPADAQQ